MSWLEVKVRTHREGAEALENLLLDAGAVSVTLTDAEDEPLFEPPPGETPLWHHLVLTGLFPQGTDAPTLQITLARAWAPQPLPPLRFVELPEQDWIRAWLDDFHPLDFGRLWVCPSWWLADADDTTIWQPPQADAEDWARRNAVRLQAMEQPGTALLRLDPGLAFGTGTHPTTALCLRTLASLDLDGQTLTDYGCGSGILGIAALLLGAACVHGVDNDPQALLASADNLRKNRLDATRMPLYLPAAHASARAEGQIRAVDGMLANILAGTLIALAADLAPQVRTGGWLLLSGILVEQAAGVVAAYTPWYHSFTITTEGDWVAIHAIRS